MDDHVDSNGARGKNGNRSRKYFQTQKRLEYLFLPGLQVLDRLLFLKFLFKDFEEL